MSGAHENRALSAKADSTYASDDAASRQTTQQGDGTALISAAAGYLSRPQEDVMEAIRQMSAVKLFWHDMRLRPNANAHRAVLLAGVLIGLIGIAMCIGMISDDAVRDRELVHYVMLERAVVAVSQIAFTGRAISVENEPLLVIANVNALGLLVRAGLKEMMDPIPNYILLGLLAAACLGHVIASAVAIVGGLTRISVFTMGSEVHIQRLYRDYQAYNALALLDLELAVLAVATVFFLMDNHWYWYMLFAVLVFFTIANGSLLRQMIQKESSRLPFAFLVPFYIALPIGVCVALWYQDFVSVHVHSNIKAVVFYNVISFVLGRLALLASVSKCFFQFGNGLKAAFAIGRDPIDFVREEGVPSYFNNIEDFFDQVEPGTESQARYGAAA